MEGKVRTLPRDRGVLGGRCGCKVCVTGLARVNPPGNNWVGFQRKFTAPRKPNPKRKST